MSEDFYRKRHVAASHELEALLISGKEVVNQLRDAGLSKDLAYALLYELRWRVGHIVHITAGVGVPRAEERRWAKDILDAQLPPRSS